MYTDIRCHNDVIAGTYRIECNISISLDLSPAMIAKVVQSIKSEHIISTAITLGDNAQVISGLVTLITYSNIHINLF